VTITKENTKKNLKGGLFKIMFEL